MIAKTKLREFGFCTKAGRASVVDVELLPNGKRITGTWCSNLRITRLSSLETLDAYANCPSTTTKMFQFVRKHGPVCIPPTGGEDFTLQVDDWLNAQADFRRGWDQLVIEPGKFITFSQMFESWNVPVEPGEFFTFHKGELFYKANTLQQLFVLELYRLSPDRVRKCRFPTCETPYYIAHDLRQRYCGEVCQRLAQNQHALKYYHSTGRKRRKESNN